VITKVRFLWVFFFLHPGQGLRNDALLNWFAGKYENEVSAHEKKGALAPLEMTMAYLKGEVLQHTPSELPGITKVSSRY